MIIKLTAVKNSGTEPVYVNMKQCTYFGYYTSHSTLKDATILALSSVSLVVKETPEEIMTIMAKYTGEGK